MASVKPPANPDTCSSGLAVPEESGASVWACADAAHRIANAVASSVLKPKTPSDVETRMAAAPYRFRNGLVMNMNLTGDVRALRRVGHAMARRSVSRFDDSYPLRQWHGARPFAQLGRSHENP